MKYFLLAIVIGLLAGGGYYLYKTVNKQGDSAEQSAAGSTDPGVTPLTPAGTKIVGNYYQYSKADYLAAKANRRPIFLYFYANWCPTCAQQEPIVKELLAEIATVDKLNKIVAFRINFNDSDTDADEKALANEFGVRYQHTMFVLNDNGVEFEKFIGQTDKGTLKGVFQEVIGL